MANIRTQDLLRALAAASPSDGRPSVRERFRAEALDLVAHEDLVAARYAFRLVELDAPAGETLRVGGEVLHAPRLLPEGGDLTGIASAVCTIGAALERRVGALFAERRVSLALALDALGNELLREVSRRTQDRMTAAARKQGLTMAGELRAGDPGLALTAQGSVLRLADAGGIGVRVTHGHALDPLKSTSMILGIGFDLPPVRWSRCDDCRHRDGCRMAGSAAAVPA